MFSSNLIGWQFTWGFLEWTKCDKEPCSSHANSRMWVTQSRSSCRLGKGKTRESIHSRGQYLYKFISNTRKHLHKTRIWNSHRFGLKHQYGHRDVTNSRIWITLRFHAFITECSYKSAATHKIERSGSPEQVVVSLLSPVLSRFIFVFALSQFSGPDYRGAWNRLLKDKRIITDSSSFFLFHRYSAFDSLTKVGMVRA